MGLCQQQSCGTDRIMGSSCDLMILKAKSWYPFESLVCIPIAAFQTCLMMKIQGALAHRSLLLLIGLEGAVANRISFGQKPRSGRTIC